MRYPDKQITILFCCFQDDHTSLRSQVYSHAFNCHLYHRILTLSFVLMSITYLTPLLYTYRYRSCKSCIPLALPPSPNIVTELSTVTDPSCESIATCFKKIQCFHGGFARFSKAAIAI